MAELGLGLAALGRPGYMTLGHAEDIASTAPDAMERQAHAVMDAADANGVRHFDAARSYGRAEEFLAHWLAARSPAGVRVSSKWGYRYTAGWQSNADSHEVKDLSRAHLDSQWEESRALLGRWLNVFQIHSVTLESGVLRDARVLERLAELKASGVEIGLSVTGARQADVIDAAVELPVFTWVQATWNVLEPSSGPALQRAKNKGLHVITKEGLANGLLSSRGRLVEWNQLASKHGMTPDALALGIALQQPFIDVVLSGAATVAHLESNLRARTAPRTDEWKTFSKSATTYWDERSRLAWT